MSAGPFNFMRGSAYKLRSDWQFPEAEHERRDREACDLHLADVRQHHKPLVSVRLKEGAPRRLREITLP
jgi:hypothetical protein